MASERWDVPEGNAWRRSRGIRGVLIIAGVVSGFAIEARTQLTIEHAWSSCVGLSWFPTYYEAPDSLRFDLFGWLLYLVGYLISFPLGFSLAARATHRHAPSVRIVAGCVIGLLALSMVSAGDLVVNVTAPDGYSVSARCSAGHPPWWPDWLPTVH